MDGSGDLWTSWDATTGFPNDAMQSVMVGPDVTLVLFWNDFNARDNGAPFHLGPGENSANLGSWNRQASAARLQWFPFGVCGGTPGTLALFTDVDFNQSTLKDCNELTPRVYGNPVDMGFRNDTTSSLINNSDRTFFFYRGSSCFPGSSVCLGTAKFTINPFSSASSMGNFNDDISYLALQ